ncbi:hypothetical protein L6164_025505 [Bauhinia variegata]|uniref:Uncharacterized protein n=1 Tax=Bauhinia variegata TaxID=167791 RepID=A0ACB9M244_BAUVA|nr:hypothetical protein L6164_025505 [Bauhinia variegata]
MVCSLGSGRMTVMARLLAAGRFSPTIAEDIGHQKSTAEYVCRELREADEANLLDEEDMHVYGLNPMTDPLHLVCCNACKKPIKASQYDAHAEICKTLKFTEQTILELDGSMGNRKPPRKEKKRLSTSYATSVGEREMSESMDAIHTSASQSNMDNQIKVPSFHIKPKDAASMMDNTGINPGNRDHPASVMHPPKRHKLITCSNLPSSENPEIMSVKAKAASFPDGIMCSDLLERTVPKGGHPADSVVKSKIPTVVHEKHLMKKDFPAPLATKIYYSQRNNRLRAALGHLYFQQSSEELCSDFASPKLSNDKTTTLENSSQRDGSPEQNDDGINKKSYVQTLSPAQNPGQILSKSSEDCMNKAGGLPSRILSNQFIVDNVSRPVATPVGLTKSNYLPRPYSFASKTGNPLGTIQQPNGKVPVV